MKVCIYCASSNNIDHRYFRATEELAKRLVENDIEVVYGGGGAGLMGKLADTVIENGGKIKGIIPRFMYDLGWGHPKVTNMLVTETMHERKERYLDDIDGAIALPGGTGTLEELLELITFKRLGKFSKPVFVLNTNGFYDPLKKMLERCADEGFMPKTDLDLWDFVEYPDGILKKLLDDV